jgi:hypothetical protein
MRAHGINKAPKASTFIAVMTFDNGMYIGIYQGKPAGGLFLTTT